jgi:hypothetical protein
MNGDKKCPVCGADYKFPARPDDHGVIYDGMDPFRAGIFMCVCDQFSVLMWPSCEPAVVVLDKGAGA